MRSPLIIVTLLVAPLAGLSQGTTAPPASEVIFHFRPPDGTRVRQTYRLERTRTAEGLPPRRDEAEARAEGTFKRVGDGFEYSQKTVSSTLRRNGSAIDDPLGELLSKVPITYVISKAGEATDIRGFDEAERLLKSTMPPQLAEALAPILSEASLVARAKAEWNGRYYDFTENRFRIGDVIRVQGPQRLPSGETIDYTTLTRFVGWEPCPAGNCVRVLQIYESDAAALAKLAQGVVDAAASAAAAPQPVPNFQSGATRVTGSLSRLIDPETMLIYSEQARRTISMRASLAGEDPVPAVLEESRTYTYSYE